MDNVEEEITDHLENVRAKIEPKVQALMKAYEQAVKDAVELSLKMCSLTFRFENIEDHSLAVFTRLLPDDFVVTVRRNSNEINIQRKLFTS